MKSSRNTARQLFGLALTLVGLLSWNTLAIHASGQAVQAATRASVTEPTGQQVSRAVANGRVAFVGSEGNAQSDIYTMNPDGSDRKQLTFSQEREDQPVWSPDGTKIAFARFNNNFGEIFVMNADGSDQRKLTQSKFDLSPTWSPDGTKIAFWRIDSITMPSSDVTSTPTTFTRSMSYRPLFRLEVHTCSNELSVAEHNQRRRTPPALSQEATCSYARPVRVQSLSHFPASCAFRRPS